MLMDLTAGYMDELEYWLDEYNQVRKVQRPEMFKLRVTKEMASKIDRILTATGYDLNTFVRSRS